MGGHHNPDVDQSGRLSLQALTTHDGQAGNCRMRGGIEDGDSVEDAPEDAAFLAHFGLLEDIDFDAEEAGEGEAGTREDNRWCRETLSSPLYPGCRYSVEQYSYAMFKIKTGSIHDDRADKLCKLVAEIMPDGFKGPKCDAPPCCIYSQFPLLCV